MVILKDRMPSHAPIIVVTCIPGMQIWFQYIYKFIRYMYLAHTKAVHQCREDPHKNHMSHPPIPVLSLRALFEASKCLFLMVYIPGNNFSAMLGQFPVYLVEPVLSSRIESCPRTQHSDSGESPTSSNPSFPSLTFYQQSIKA